MRSCRVERPGSVGRRLEKEEEEEEEEDKEFRSSLNSIYLSSRDSRFGEVGVSSIRGG